MIFQQTMNKLALNPRRIFLLDGFGALLSAFLLGVILVRLETTFGMPQKALYFLAFLPCIFAVYDFICYKKINENWRPFVKIIAIANLIYCCISIGFVFQHFPQLTNLGFIYFVLELIIVILIAWIELRLAANKPSNGLG